jgi:hypothetical protein
MKIPKSLASLFKRKPKARGAVGANHASQSRPVYYRPRPRNIEDINPVPSYALPAKHSAIPADVANNLRYYRHPNGHNYPFPPQHPSVGQHPPPPRQMPSRQPEQSLPPYQHRPEEVRAIASGTPQVPPQVHSQHLSRESYGKLAQNEKQLTTEVNALERQLIGKSFSDPDYLDTLQALGKLKAQRELTRNEIAKYSGRHMSTNHLNEMRADVYTSSTVYRQIGQNRPAPPMHPTTNTTASRTNTQPPAAVPQPGFYGSYIPTSNPTWKYTHPNSSNTSISSFGSYSSSNGSTFFSHTSANSSRTSLTSNGSSYYAVPPNNFSTTSFNSSFSTANPHPIYKHPSNFSASSVHTNSGMNRPTNLSYDTSLFAHLPPATKQEIREGYLLPEEIIQMHRRPNYGY